MGILEDLDRKYRYLQRADETDELYEQFATDMQMELASLTPDQRIEIFQSIIGEAKEYLEDCSVEFCAGECVRQLMLIQIMKQLVPHG